MIYNIFPHSITAHNYKCENEINYIFSLCLSAGMMDHKFGLQSSIYHSYQNNHKIYEIPRCEETEICIWYSHNINEYMTFLYLVNELKEYQLSFVNCSEIVEQGSIKIQRDVTTEIPPEALKDLRKNKRVMCDDEIKRAKEAFDRIRNQSFEILVVDQENGLNQSGFLYDIKNMSFDAMDTIISNQNPSHRLFEDTYLYFLNNRQSIDQEILQWRVNVFKDKDD